MKSLRAFIWPSVHRAVPQPASPSGSLCCTFVRSRRVIAPEHMFSSLPLSMMIVCHNKTKRRWFESSPMLQPWWKWPTKTLDRQTFAADMLFNGAAEQNFPRNMPADAWFDFKGCDRHEIEEQSFLLPDDEILTILKLPDAAIA